MRNLKKSVRVWNADSTQLRWVEALAAYTVFSATQISQHTEQQTVMYTQAIKNSVW